MRREDKILTNLYSLLNTVTGIKTESIYTAYDGCKKINSMQFLNTHPLLLATNNNETLLILPHGYYLLDSDFQSLTNVQLIKNVTIDVGFYDKNGVPPYNYYYKSFAIADLEFSKIKEFLIECRKHIYKFDFAKNRLPQYKYNPIKYQQQNYYKNGNILMNLFNSVANKLMEKGLEIQTYNVKSRFLDPQAFVAIPIGRDEHTFSLNLHSSLANKVLESHTKDIFNELKERDVVKLPSSNYAY